MNEELIQNYRQLFYQLEVSKYFKEILQENLNVHLIKLNKHLGGLNLTRKKKNKVKEEKAKLSELVNSLKHHTLKMLELTNEIKDIERLISLNKKDLMTEEETINERILNADRDLDQVTRPLSEEIINNLQEMVNINEALKFCDLINYKSKSKYELSQVYGIHKDIFINYEIMDSFDYLYRELNSMLSLINKRYSSKKTNATQLIHEKVGIDNLPKIITKLCDYLVCLEKENAELKKTRISVIQKYCS